MFKFSWEAFLVYIVCLVSLNETVNLNYLLHHYEDSNLLGKSDDVVKFLI